MRVVFDTNIYISAFITPGGKGESALMLVIEKRAQLFTSVPILTETADKLMEKFDWDVRHAVAAVDYIANLAETVKPHRKLSILADEPDNRILECASAAGADCIVTGDKHLLALKEFEGVEICRLADFLNRCQK